MVTFVTWHAFHHPYFNKIRLPQVQNYCPHTHRCMHIWVVFAYCIRMKLGMWQCYNSQHLGKDEIFGWLPELAQKYLSSLAPLRFARVFLLHIRSLQKLSLCLFLFHKSIRGTNMPHPCHTQSLLEFKL